MARIRIRHLIAIAAVAIGAIVVVAYLFQIRYLALPVPSPPDLPTGAYDETRLSAKEAKFKQLADEYRMDSSHAGESRAQFAKRVGSKYDRLYRETLGDQNSPEDLAMLALWGYKQPTFWSDGVYDDLFFGNIELLGKMKGERARYALWKIRQQVQHDGKFDGHFAETIVEAEEEQNKVQ